MIENETAGIARPSTKVLDVEIESLHDARGEKNCGAA